MGHRVVVVCRRLVQLGLAVSVALAAGVASGQEAESHRLRELSIRDLMNLQVDVASVKAESLLDAPSTVTVIDQDMIREFNLQSVADALDLVAGFSVVRTYLKRNLPTARGVLQDHYANKVLVMINGVPTWMAVTGEGCLDRVDINDVERIEVLKGPASVLYGTNAYAGAVNIILKDPQEASSEVHFGVAERFGYSAGGHFLYNGDRFRLQVAGNGFDDPSEGVRFTGETGVSGDVDQYMRGNNFTVSGQGGPHSFLLNVYEVDESFLGTAPKYSLGIGHNHHLQGYVGSYAYHTSAGDAVALDFGATVDENERNFSRSFDDNTRANVVGNRINGFARAVITASERLTIEAGLDYEQRESREYRNYNVREGLTLADNNMGSRDVREYSAFAQLDYRLDKWRWLVGTRYTDNELFGDNVSSRATLVYSVSEQSSVKAIFGQSFRVPSLFELYFRTPTNTVWGNTELGPEKSDSFELAYLGSFGDLSFEALVYHADYDDKIFRTKRYPDYVDDPTDTSTIYVNGQPFSADGAEIGLRYRRPKSLSAFLNLAVVNGDRGDEIEGTDHYNFKYVPEQTLSAGIAKRIGELSGSLIVRYQSEMGAPLETIDAQTTVDLGLTYRQQLGQARVRHTISAVNVGGDEVDFPEYVRRNINQVPSGYGRRVSYTVSVVF